MRRMTLLVTALALVLGLAQCKKAEMPTDNPTGGISITLDVDGGASSGSKVNVNPNDPDHDYATVTFETGDTIYVANDGKYRGFLIYNGSKFVGTISGTNFNDEDYLHFYFLGGLGFKPTIDETNNTATVNISNQTTKYPVISYAHSNEFFTGGGTYTAKLQNKVSIMKFNVTTPSSAAICITGMNNKVTVDFTAPSGTDNGFEYDMEGEGLIEIPAKGANNETWVIVLPQEALSAGAVGTAFTYDGYKGNRPALDAIASNQYITTVADVLDVNTFDINYMSLTFEAKKPGATVTINKTTNAPTVSLQTSTDGITWTPFTVGTTTITLTNVGDKVMFRGTNSQYATSNTIYNYFSLTDECYVYGNIMSLIDATNYTNLTSLTDAYTFAYLFKGCAGLYNHSEKTLKLPATTLANNCYAYMFDGCTGLTAAPVLPATTLTTGCYSYMFNGCTGLTAAPALPATTLAINCYGSMFRSCIGLTEAPELPAPALTRSCYQNMFYGCRNLKSITCLATSGISSSGSTLNWMSNAGSSVEGTKTFTKDPNVPVSSGTAGLYWLRGDSGIPSGWEVVDYSGK